MCVWWLWINNEKSLNTDYEYQSLMRPRMRLQVYSAYSIANSIFPSSRAFSLLFHLLQHPCRKPFNIYHFTQKNVVVVVYVFFCKDERTKGMMAIKNWGGEWIHKISTIKCTFARKREEKKGYDNIFKFFFLWDRQNATRVAFSEG